MSRPFEAVRARKIERITEEYQRRLAIGFPVTLEGNAETLQIAREVDRSNWLTVYTICSEGVAYEAAQAIADPDFEPNPAAIYLQATSNARYFMTFSAALGIIRDLRSFGLAAWANWNALKEAARAAERREDLDLIDLDAGWP